MILSKGSVKKGRRLGRREDKVLFSSVDFSQSFTRNA